MHDVPDETTTAEIDAVRKRRATVIRLIGENDGKKDSDNPHAREAIAALMKRLRDEKKALAETLIGKLQDRLIEVADEVARALGLNEKQLPGYRSSAEQPVRLAMQEIERKRLDADDELHIRELDKVIAEQAKLLQWTKDAKGESKGEVLGLESYVNMK